MLKTRENEVTGLPHVELLVGNLENIPSTRRDWTANTPAFRSLAGEVFSLNDLVKRLLSEHPAMKISAPGKHRIPCESADRFDFLADERMGRVRLRVVADVVIHEAKLSFDVSEYRQTDDDGALAWVLFGEIPRLAIGTINKITVTFRPGPDLKFRTSTTWSGRARA
jgi:hypothetical protein